MWTTYSLFGFFPAYDAKPCLLTEEQVLTLQDHFQSVNGPIRLQEVNLDVSNLSWYGFHHLNISLDKHSHIRVRLSGVWTENIHNDLLWRLGGRLSGFDMTVQISGTNPLAKGAETLFDTLTRIRNAVSIPGARLRLMTDKGNTIDIPDLQILNSPSFDIIQDDEPFDFALTQYFGLLQSKLFCDNGFSDADVPILQNLIAQCPSRLRYVSIPIHGLSPQTLRDLENPISKLSKGVELKIYLNESELMDNTKLQACLHFISKIANRTCELDIENITNLDECISDKVSDALPIWPVLQSVSLRHIQTAVWFSTWMQWMVASKKLHSVYFVSLLNIDPVQWNDILKDMPFHTLKSIRIKSSRFPSGLLQVIVNRIPQAGGDLKTLDIECHEKPKRTWYRKKKKPASRIPFEAGVLSKATNCVATAVYNWKK